MKLKLKIWLILGLVMLLLLAVFNVLELREAEDSARADLRRQALELRAVVMATRRVYHEQFLRSGLPLTDQTLGFLPAHAMSRISADIQNWSDSRSRFNNVSDRPRNPANLADANELAAMAWHRDHAKASERIAVIRDADGEDYFHFTAPIWTEPYCLKCHASQAAAPATISRRYGQAYGYRVGDLRGVMSIKIPMRELNERVMKNWTAEFIEHVVLMLSLLAVLGLLLNRLVIRRLDQLGAAVRRMAAGDYAGKVAGKVGTDEIDLLGNGFDQMAEAVLQRDRALAASEAKSRALAELAPVGLFRTDAQGACIYVNEHWQQITGLDAAASSGEGWASALHPADRARVVAEWQAASAAGQTFSSEFRFLKPTGEVLWVLGRASAEIGPDGRVVGHVGTVTDITARKRAEELEHFSAFQAGIAEMNTSVLHNIGNAITAVTQEAEGIEQSSGDMLRVADLLAANAAGSEAEAAAAGPLAPLTSRQCAIQREAARTIQQIGEQGLRERARRLGSGVRHIADIVRIQQNAALPGNQASSFSLMQTVQSALELQGDVFRKLDIEVVVEIDPAVDQIRHAHNRLLQVLVNVFKNSIEAIREKARLVESDTAFRGRLTIRAEALEQARLVLIIEDNGIGFAPDLHDQLFQFGFSTKQRGSGFGLHSVAVFIRECGGSLRLESGGRGLGARLSLELPIDQSADSEGAE